jgi:DNA repair protein RAD5
MRVIGGAGVRVMLLSLKAGGLGLTLTCANLVLVVDPWWCPAAEQQAIDRVHRLGQKRDVQVKRFVIRDTVEQRILRLQEKKNMLVRGTLANRQEVQGLRLEELKELFGF